MALDSWLNLSVQSKRNHSTFYLNSFSTKCWSVFSQKIEEKKKEKNLTLNIWPNEEMSGLYSYKMVKTTGTYEVDQRPPP